MSLLRAPSVGILMSLHPVCNFLLLGGGGGGGGGLLEPVLEVFLTLDFVV